MAKKSEPVGFWHMVRDVLIASMNKGQFPPALAGAVFMVMIMRMPSERVADLAFLILEYLKQGWLVGYFTTAVSIGGWFFHSKSQRRVITEEMRRLANQRSALQKRELGNQVKSSQPSQATAPEKRKG